MLSHLSSLSPLKLRGGAVERPPAAACCELETAEVVSGDRVALGAGLLLGISLLGGCAQPAPQQQVQVRTPDGVLYVADRFSPNQSQHGDWVISSAQEEGFRGPIVKDGPVIAPAPVGAATAAAPPAAEQPVTYDSLYQQGITCQAGNLNSAFQVLQRREAEGAHHAAVNFSRGCGPFMVLDNLYREFSPGFRSGDPAALRRLQQAAPLFGVNYEDLVSSDAARNVPARLKFQLGLANLALQSSRDPRVMAAQDRWDGAVHRLAERQVSVVVSAGNQGALLDNLARDTGGRRLQAPADFWRNRLANTETLTVGALRGEQVANYSNYDPGIDVYADGVARNAQGQTVMEGTSFAAPRASAAAAELHRLHPSWSNGQVHGYIASHLTDQEFQLAGHPVAPQLNVGSLFS